VAHDHAVGLALIDPEQLGHLDRQQKRHEWNWAYGPEEDSLFHQPV
jgi:hypothetical protein